VLDVLRSGWRWMLGLLVLGVLVGVGYVAVTPPTYRATTQLVVSPRAPVPDVTAAYQSSLLATRLASTYSTLLQGRDFADLLVTRLSLPMTPDELRAALAVSPLPDSNLITATVDARDPRTAQQVANALGPMFGAFLLTLDVDQAAARTGGRVAVAESAARPTSPVGPQPVQDIGLTGSMGLLLGVTMALSRQRRRTVAQRAVEFESRTGIPVLGLLSRRWGQEEIRELRTIVQAVPEQAKHTSLALAGIRAGLGTPELVEALADSFADLGDRVLVIRADQATSLGSSGPESFGVADVVSGRMSLAEAVREGEGDRPDVLDRGGQVPALDVLGSPGMRQVLEDAESLYDLVLVHCPPTSQSAAAISVGSRGARLLVLAAERDLGKEPLDAALRRLEQARVRVVGVVVVAGRAKAGGRRRRQARHEAPAVPRVAAREAR
jgi:succinoglycan biosynthesis transport protein ExoP